jgi:hypothetical protein
MAVDVGQVLMLALAVPAMCLLLYVLTQVEKWLLKDDSPHLRGQTGTGAGEGGEEGQLIPGPPGAVDAAAASRAAARDEDAPGTAPPGGMNEAA